MHSPKVFCNRLPASSLKISYMPAQSPRAKAFQGIDRYEVNSDLGLFGRFCESPLQRTKVHKNAQRESPATTTKPPAPSVYPWAPGIARSPASCLSYRTTSAGSSILTDGLGSSGSRAAAGSKMRGSSFST